jgi:hypothetical protein
VFINTVDANTGYTADVAMDSFICQSANAGYTADAAMHSYICQTQVCSYSSTHFYQQIMTALLFYLPVGTMQCIYIPLLITVYGGLRPSTVVPVR